MGCRYCLKLDASFYLGFEVYGFIVHCVSTLVGTLLDGGPLADAGTQSSVRQRLSPAYFAEREPRVLTTGSVAGGANDPEVFDPEKSRAKTGGAPGIGDSGGKAVNNTTEAFAIVSTGIGENIVVIETESVRVGTDTPLPEY